MVALRPSAGAKASTHVLDAREEDFTIVWGFEQLLIDRQQFNEIFYLVLDSSSFMIFAAVSCVIVMKGL